MALPGDSFDDNSIDTAKWSNWGGGQVVEQNQRLEITSALGGNYVGMDSPTTNLVGAYAGVEIVSTGALDLSSWEVYPISIIQSPGNQNLWFIGVTNILRAYKQLSSVNTILKSDTYDPNVHKYFRIRETDGTTYWEYSTNGYDWTVFISDTNSLTMSSVVVDVLCGTWQAEAATRTALFDNFNNFPSAGRGASSRSGSGARDTSSSRSTLGFRNLV